MKRTLAERLGIYWPFPRLRFRLRHGYWCEHRIPSGDMDDGSPDWHPTWEPGDRPGGWRRIDPTGREMRRCGQCEWAEFR